LNNLVINGFSFSGGSQNSRTYKNLKTLNYLPLGVLVRIKVLFQSWQMANILKFLLITNLINILFTGIARLESLVRKSIEHLIKLSKYKVEV
jgi:hypothetical protein